LVIIETDILVALASREDKHHLEAKEVLEKADSVSLSPYSLFELDLLIASGVIKVEPTAFYRALADVLSYFEITILRPEPSHLATAWELRNKYGLSFFDSLHAAVAIEERDILVSYDRAYSSVKELTYIRPADLLADRS